MGYPAATVSANLGGILIDVDAVVRIYAGRLPAPIDNKLCVAHAYSEQVLEVARQKKTTPKSERAKSICLFRIVNSIYISPVQPLSVVRSLKE